MAQKTKTKARFVINMNTGSHGFRTAETDALPLTFRLIDDDVCKALCQGRISGMQVVEALKKDMMSQPGFSWEKFDRQRQAEKQRMNVSQHDMVPVGDDSEKDGEPEVVEDIASLSSLGLGTAGAPKPQTSDAPAKKDADAAKKPSGRSAIDAALGG